jgi:signal-transduction protein with cAMP-binding, CBS, and nucleotidyltransferase domain
VVRGVAESLPPDAPIGPLCSRELVGVSAEADAGEAVRLMRQYALRRLPVVDDGQVAGMVSLGDLAIADDERSALAQLSKADPNTLRALGGRRDPYAQ